VRQGSDGGTLCISGSGDPSLTWADLQVLAASAAQRQLQQRVPFTSLTIDTSVYSGDITPDTWEWADLWAVLALRSCRSVISTSADIRVQDYGAVPSALIVNENSFSLSISPAAMPVRAPRSDLAATNQTKIKLIALCIIVGGRASLPSGLL
jgi:D-alanyl-D-alanine carboxypeptidase